MHNKKRLKVTENDENTTQQSMSTQSSCASPLDWQFTISKAINSIVSIRFAQVSAFDTESSVNSEATGFVVDAERGIILTNRHVVCAGPFIGEAIFHDHEEVLVHPIYRDPIHDFGFLRFDPKDVKYMKVEQIELAPELAQVGLEIRVVGNDAGEKLSILSGSISRLNRNAPEYGDMTYNDFNTFYLQAASSTSGGSSGSPVLNIQGKAVALNAGGSTAAATDFFFPLDRVKRALELVRLQSPIPRGTIQVQFYHRPFDEVKRLGLNESTEAIIRSTFPNEIGMLVVETVLPLGPASCMLEEGDILISINDELITQFVPLENVMDDMIHQDIHLVIERGGKRMNFSMKVQDLHAITPHRYLSVGGAILNDLSYQLARQYAVQVDGVFVAQPGGIFKFESDSGWVISSINAIPTPNLDAFIEVYKTLSAEASVPMTYHSIGDVHTKYMTIITIDGHWTSFKLATRNDHSGLWDFKDLGKVHPELKIQPLAANFPDRNERLLSKNIFCSLVTIKMFMPFRIEGSPRSWTSIGFIIDAKRGWVVCSRTTVPNTLGTITLTIADSVVIPAKVKFMHPTHNFVILSYDPHHIQPNCIQSIIPSTSQLTCGQKTILTGYNRMAKPICIEATVTDVSISSLATNPIPRFRAINFNAIQLDSSAVLNDVAGVLSDSEGNVQGFWTHFLANSTSTGQENVIPLGIHIQDILAIVDKLKRQESSLRGLAIEVSPISIVEARHMGVSDEWVNQLKLHRKREFLQIKRIECDSLTSQILQNLDIILSIENKTITDIRDIEVQREWPTTVSMTIVRSKQEIKVQVPTTEMNGEETMQVIQWAGAFIHEPHRAVRQQSLSLPSHVYIAARIKGSPAQMYGLVPTGFITHINGHETKDLKSFLQQIQLIPDGDYVRVKTVSFDGIPVMVSIKTCHHYFPTTIYQRTIKETDRYGWI